MEKPHVLVADDNEATRTLLMALLRREFSVDIATDGMETIAKLKRRQYAAIVLDLLMPQVDGYAVLDFLRSDSPGLLQRVLVVTASVTSRDMERVRQYAVGKVLTKPFDIDDLVTQVKECAAT